MTFLTSFFRDKIYFYIIYIDLLYERICMSWKEVYVIEIGYIIDITINTYTTIKSTEKALRSFDFDSITFLELIKISHKRRENIWKICLIYDTPNKRNHKLLFSTSVTAVDSIIFHKIFLPKESVYHFKGNFFSLFLYVIRNRVVTASEIAGTWRAGYTSFSLRFFFPFLSLFLFPASTNDTRRVCKELFS